MDRTETRKLMTLLRELFQTWKPKDEKNFVLAWALALEPYEYEDIKNSTIEYARSHKYFPDVADLTVGAQTTEQKARRERRETAAADYIAQALHTTGGKR